jgi:membrane-associated PAP2 superfamily phosphatase
LGLLLTAGFVAYFRLTSKDLAWSSLAFSPTDPHWPLHDWPLFALLHRDGEWPGRVLGIGSLLGLSGSFLKDSWRRWRRPCLYLGLLFVLGPGLLVNVLGKSLMGRPRPYTITAFGGTRHYLPPFAFNTEPGDRKFGLVNQDELKSFLSGHESMAFLFIGFFFLWQGWKRWVILFLTLGFGALMGMARIAQGDHFPSDVLLCGALLYTLAAALSPILHKSDQRILV